MPSRPQHFPEESCPACIFLENFLVSCYIPTILPSLLPRPLSPDVVAHQPNRGGNQSHHFRIIYFSKHNYKRLDTNKAMLDGNTKDGQLCKWLRERAVRHYGYWERKRWRMVKYTRKQQRLPTEQFKRQMERTSCCYNRGMIDFYGPRSREIMRLVTSVRLSVFLFTLSRLNRLTYDLDIWYVGRPWPWLGWDWRSRS